MYDAVVVGSDQIWNLDITGNDFNFFLPFDGIKKYSYAASIGKKDIKQKLKYANKNRDLSGVKI